MVKFRGAPQAVGVTLVRECGVSRRGNTVGLLGDQANQLPFPSPARLLLQPSSLLREFVLGGRADLFVRYSTANSL